MTGASGGAPNTSNSIQLGDVAITKPDGSSGRVIQYNLEGKIPRTGSLNQVLTVMLRGKRSSRLCIKISMMLRNVLPRGKCNSVIN